jgi:hypothetical protein
MPSDPVSSQQYRIMMSLLPVIKFFSSSSEQSMASNVLVVGAPVREGSGRLIWWDIWLRFDFGFLF